LVVEIRCGVSDLVPVVIDDCLAVFRFRSIDLSCAGAHQLGNTLLRVLDVFRRGAQLAAKKLGGASMLLEIGSIYM
jgi:hypothetical protein